MRLCLIGVPSVSPSPLPEVVGDPNPAPGDIESFLSAMIDRFGQNYSAVRAAFRAADPGRSGVVLPSQFRRVFEHFLFPIDDTDFGQLLAVLGIEEVSAAVDHLGD